MSTKIFAPRRGTSTVMSTANKTKLILANGELFVEMPASGSGKGHCKIKLGDGKTPYASLPYALGDTSNDEIKFTEDTASTSVSAALNNVVSGKNLGTIIAGLKKAISLTSITNASQSSSGLMSAADKKKLDGIAAGAQVNSITGVKGNAEGSYRTGNVNITAANIGLGNVNNTADADKTVAKANQLTTPRSIGIDGAVTGTATNFNGTQNITIPTTSVDATKLKGVIPVENIPPAALERCIVVDDKTAMFALTEDDVQLGDTIKLNDTGVMYLVVDTSALDSAAGYAEYTAGSASAVAWTGVTDKPNLVNTVNGRSGEIKLTKSDVGLDAVTNYDSSTSVKNITRSGLIFTATRVNGKTFTFDQKDTTYTNATQAASGLMSADDKTKLDGIADGAQVNTVTSVAGRTGAVTVTKSDVGLGNVTNYDSSTAVTNITRSGKTFTATRVNGKTFTFDQQDTTYGAVSDSANGLMTPTLLSKLNGIAAGAQVNSITGVKGDAEGSYRTGNVNITAANIGLGNVNNTADSAKSVAKAAQLTTARTIGISGAVTGAGVSFNGTSNITINTTAVDATKLTGTIDIARLPAGALERCVVVADDTARFKLTEADVQTGDTVKVTATGKMYFITDSSSLSTEAGYELYTAGSATSVPWSGVSGKPSLVNSVAGRSGTVTLSKSDVGLGNVANIDQSKAIKSITRSGLTFNYTTLDGSTGTFTQQDTTYSVMKGATTDADGTSGLVVKPTKGAANRYYRSDGQWVVPPNTTYGAVSDTANGLMTPALLSKLNGIAAGAQVNTVTSVAGRTGAVTLSKSDVGLGSVDNTADSAKSVAKAAQLTTGRTIQTNLGSTAAGTFDGTKGITIGVTGTLPVANGGTGLTTIAAGQVLIGNGTSAVTTRAIDGTSGGTSSSSALITSGAVYSGLAGKLGSGATAVAADKLATARNIKLTGDVSGSASFNGTADANITATVADDSHNHSMLSATDLTDKTQDLNDLTLNGASAPYTKLYIEKTTGGASKITNLPEAANPFVLIVQAIRYATNIDYICSQKYFSAVTHKEYTRYYTIFGTSGSWSGWTQNYTTENKPSKADVGLGSVTNYDSSIAIENITRSGLTFTATRVNGDTFTFTQQDTTYGDASTSGHGLMTAAMVTKLNGIAAGAQVNSVTSVAGKTGAVTLSKSDVGLGSVDNTADTNKDVATARLLKSSNSNASISASTWRGSITDGVVVWGQAFTDSKDMGNSDTGDITLWMAKSGTSATLNASINGDFYANGNNKVYHTGNKPSKSDVGLGNVDNTADANKSVKYATSAGSASSATSASKADQLTTARTIGISGAVTGAGVSFNGTSNITINTTAVDATKLTGTIDIARIPVAALERCVVVADDTARYKLTTSNVQLGDTVKVTSTGLMYLVTDTGNLANANGYTVYTAGSAASVPWSGVSSKPSLVNSVAGRSGAVTLSKSDVGLGNVDNTADANKSVKYATSAGSASSATSASKADQLTTARTISISGGATGTATSFNGTSNITIPVTALDMSKATAGTLPIARGGTGATNAATACSNIGALPIAGGTMTGVFGTANGVANKAGDDAYFGNANIGGSFVIKSQTSTPTSLSLLAASAGWGASSRAMITYNTTDNCIDFSFV